MTIKKKISVLFASMMLICMLFSVNTYAAVAESSIQERDTGNDYVSDTLSLVYNDEYNVSHVLKFDCSCAYSAEWDGYAYGVITSAVFSVSNATIDGASCAMPSDGSPSSFGSGWAQEFNPNYSRNFVRVVIYCNEWGEGSLGAERVW